MATATPKHSIFRSKTVQAYIQNKEKSVLPRFVAPPVFVLCWVVLILLIFAGIIIWHGQIPVYIAGSGVIAEPGTSPDQGDEATAIILFPLGSVPHLQRGLPIQVQLDQNSPMLNGRITAVSTNPLNPREVLQQYGLPAAGPSLVVTTNLGHALSAHLYAGSHIQAQLQIGSQSLLSLFPVVNSL